MDRGNIGGGNDALPELEGTFHPVTVDGTDHLNIFGVDIEGWRLDYDLSTLIVFKYFVMS